ncbi:hypothetical protein DD596_25620 [Enterobacter cloacae complex sp. 4DZ3-28B]|nr:hypothetical protein DD596_25620 [Enterobacter cloacae complex sp. 4DZ3-28B]
MAGFFDEISFHHVPREENQMADALATLASMFQLTPHGDLLYIEFWCRGNPHIVVGWKRNGTVSLGISISSDTLKAKSTHRRLPTMTKGH